MPTNTPRVSVLMASYNYAQFVGGAIQSVWNQTFRDIELIVIDDGSTDDSPRIIEEMKDRSPIPMQFHRQPNAGPSAAVNHALSHARGEWLCLLACDDFYAPHFVERNLARAALFGPRDVVLHSNAYLVEASGRITGILGEISQLPPLRGAAFHAFARGQGMMLPSTMFLRKSLLLRAGAFDPEILAEDCDLTLRLARNAEFDYIEEPIFYSRYTPGSLGKRPWVWGDGILKALAKHEDLLGSDLPLLLSKASENIAAGCFEQGNIPSGLHWARTALGHAPRGMPRIETAARLAGRSARALVRYGAMRLFGRERLVVLKRKLQRY